MKKNALIIFIKNPRLGQVKTRLARTVGDDHALEIYLELTRITRENALILLNTEIQTPPGRGVSCYLFYGDYINATDDWSNDYFQKHLQTGDDLGDRMLNAFQIVSQKHSQVCIIGSDCPTLSVSILEQAFQELATHDFVIGPSTDGGYYLLGINFNLQSSSRRYDQDKFQNSEIAPPQYIFKNMLWSTDTVLSETIKRIKAVECSFSLLHALTDVDVENDWLNYQKQIGLKG